MSRAIVVGDVHGCLKEFEELLQLVEFRPGEDRLVLVGDLVDRGPDSVGVVRRSRVLGGVLVQSNHDEKMVRYARHQAVEVAGGKKNPMKFTDERKKIFHSLAPADLAYLAAAPLVYRLEGLDRPYLVVHGGLEPRVPVEKQLKNVCVRLRFVSTRTGKFADSEPGEKPGESVHWAKVWDGPEDVICGHNVHDLKEPLVTVSAGGSKVYSIDTGLAFGGRLTAMVLEPGSEPRFVQVQGWRAYAKWLGNCED